jgi:hypothetical protein
MLDENSETYLKDHHSYEITDYRTSAQSASTFPSTNIKNLTSQEAEIDFREQPSRAGTHPRCRSLFIRPTVTSRSNCFAKRARKRHITFWRCVRAARMTDLHSIEASQIS